jgi:hypothetical protein
VYTKIEEIFWKDEKMRLLSDDSKLLMLYILTCPHRNIIGFYFLPVQYGAYDLGWDNKRFAKGLSELLSNGRIMYNETNNIILIKNYLKHNPLENPNQVKSAVKSLDSIPVNPLDVDFLAVLKQLNKQLYQPLMERLGKRYAKPVTGTGAVTVTVTGTITGAGKEPETVPSPTPYGKIKEAYNKICVSLPRIQAMTDSRKEKVKVRWGELGTIERFEEVFIKAESTPFLKGNNDRNWKATFDWLMENDKNYLKVLEGAYDKGKNDGPLKPPPGANFTQRQYDKEHFDSLYEEV